MDETDRLLLLALLAVEIVTAVYIYKMYESLTIRR